MKLHTLKSVTENGWSTLTSKIETARLGSQDLWFSVPQEYEHYLCRSRLDGFLVGLLYPAMHYGEDIYVDGCVSERLLFNLQNYVVPLMAAFSPACRRVNISARETSSEKFVCQGIGTGFSGGVDSFSTIFERHASEQSPDRKINSLLFLNVGAHGSGKTDSELRFSAEKFRERYRYLKAFPDEIGLDFIPVDSNLHAFHHWGHLKTDTLTSAAGILILQGLYSRYYYASTGYTYENQVERAHQFSDVSVAEYCDPMILPLLSTESLELILDGMQRSRTEKTLHILDYEPVYRFLNVCVSHLEPGAKNCSTCSKCSRTLMTLNSIGKIDQFQNLFDIPKYRRAESKYVARQVLLAKIDPFASSNVALARSKGVLLPPLVFCIVYLLPEIAFNLVRRTAKAIVPRAKYDRIVKYIKTTAGRSN